MHLPVKALRKEVVAAALSGGTGEKAAFKKVFSQQVRRISGRHCPVRRG
jgi:hypothetical protein